MMKKNLIAAAVMALGISAVVPTVARADWRRDDDRRDRDYREWRHEDRRDVRRDYDDDFDRNISLRDVPRNVLDTVNDARRGRRIESIQLVHRNGNLFYRFRIDDPGWRDRDVNLRVSPGGKLMSVEEAGRVDYGFVDRR